MQARYTSRQSLSKRQLSHHDRCGVAVSYEIRMLVMEPLQLLMVLPSAATKASRIGVHGVGNRGRSRLILVESRCLEGYGEGGVDGKIPVGDVGVTTRVPRLCCY
jgi:hypothetical protein